MTDFFAKLLANNSEDPSTIKELSSNLLRGLGNILNISAQDASVVWDETAWYEIDREKVIEYACTEISHVPLFFIGVNNQHV